MKIRVNFTRDENKNYFGSDSAEIDLDTYVWGVCASECGGASLEAQKALAVAARTNGYYKNKKDGAISDSSAKAQAFRASRLTDAYKVSKQAAEETSNLILYCNKKIAEPCAFSSNNGGRTASSQSRWGGYRSFLIEQDDPYDNASKVTGHRIGLSQFGANNRAKAGHSFKQILNFYYPTTYLHNLSTGEDIYFDDKEEEDKDMAVETVKASQLIPIFKEAVEEHWEYVEGGHSAGSVDCSGLFYYAYKKLGSYMYQGSNTIYRKYTVERGKKSEINVVPGMAVFVNKDDGREPDRYLNDGIGNMSHIGMYVGNGLVAEAKGKKYGCVYSNLSDKKWSYAAKLKYTIYDVDNADVPAFIPFVGEVTTNSGSLNLRDAPSGAKIGSIPKGTILNITDQNGEWYRTSYNGLTGYVSTKYITKVESEEKAYTVKLYPVPESKLNAIKEYASSLGVTCSIEGAD